MNPFAQSFCDLDLEGQYTTWTIQAIYDTGVAISGNDCLGIKNNGEVYWHDQSEYTVYTISSAGALLATLEGDLSVTGFGRVASIEDEYKLLYKWGDGVDGTHREHLVVQKGSVLLWQRNVYDDEGIYTLEPDAPWPIDEDLLAISPSGEWIAVMVKEDKTGNGLIFIYKGSP